MQASPSPNSANGTHQPPGLGVDDVLFTLFRHKQIILAGFILGILGAGVVRVVYRPLWVSEAKLNVPYIAEHLPAGPVDPEGVIKQTDPNGQMTIGTEVEILKSFDISSNVAYVIKPERILPKKSRSMDVTAAAGFISANLEVAPPQRASILTLYFRHSDPTVVQPVLTAFIEAYKLKHFIVHGSKFDDDFFQRRVNEMKAQIQNEERELKEILLKAQVISIDDTKKSYQERILKLTEQLADAQRELAERKSVLGDTVQLPGQSTTNTLGASPSPEKIEEYNDILAQLNTSKQQLQEFKAKAYKEAHPLVMAVRGHIEDLNKQKAGMISQFPALANITSTAGLTNAPGVSLATDLNDIKRLTARVAWLSNEITNLQALASRMIEIEPLVNSIRNQLNLDTTNYQAYVNGLQAARNASSFDVTKQVSINTVEEPTPPSKDTKKLKKLLGAVFGGCFGLGLGLAFLIDFVLDRSIKRTVDIERHLRLPVFQSIPDTAWSNRLRLPWSNGDSNGHTDPAHAGENGHTNTSVAKWDPAQHLQMYTEGLRERLMTYFEVNGLTKKPKMVGLTACARGSGVTTLASGLAASLSKTGTGNVLFVDLNNEESTTQAFYDGKAACGISDALRPGNHADAKVKENLFAATAADGASGQLVKYEPGRIAHLMPKIKESDYDYIIFDLPPVSQTSATARLAGYMDITLLVVESERTGQQPAAKASALMRDARANVAAVLNKYRRHVPQALSQDL